MEDHVDDQIDEHKIVPSLSSSILLGTTILAVILLVFSTNPTAGGPRIVLLFLVLMFCLALQVVTVIIRLVFGLLGRSISSSRTMATSVLTAFSVVFLIGLATLNQVSVVDFVLVGLLESLLLFYVNRRF